MREIVLHKRFLKDLRKLKLTQTQAETYKTILVNCSILPKESRDHKLIGNYSGFREFHIGGDIVVIYFFDERNNRIIFTRIGSHSELFKK
jgi:mRNA interferase YafQ